MRKDALVSLLDKQSASREDYRIVWLEKFLASDKVRLRNDSDDISIDDFLSYLNAKLDDEYLREEFFSQSFLKSKDPSAALFREFFDAEQKFGVENLGKFASDLPGEIWEKEILPTFDSDAKAASLLAQTASVFYKTMQPKLAKHWQQRLLDAGCDPKPLNKLIETKAVKNYKKLYEACRRVTDPGAKLETTISYDWELIALSGELPAIVSYLSLSKRIPSSPDWFAGNLHLFHLVAASGSVAAMTELARRGFNPAKSTGADDSILSLSATTGDLPAVKCAWNLLAS